MSTWKQTIRRETGLIEHICEHNVGHPAWGSADWMALSLGDDRADNSWLIHGCDGCCHDDEWLVADLKEGVAIANNLIMEHKGALELLQNALDIKDQARLRKEDDDEYKYRLLEEG